MKYIVICIRALLCTIFYIIIYIIVFDIRLLWDFKLIRYSDITSNDGVEYETDPVYNTTFSKKVPLRYDSNPIETFKRKLKEYN